MNRVVPSGPSTDSTARPWQELLRSIASRQRRCSQPERKEHPKSGPTARKGSAAFRRPTPNGSYAAVSVPMRSR
jgi:hypothetical protein